VRRNVIAIIGSAGTLPTNLRRKVEALAWELSKSGFDLVTGGTDGIMRAVARGHSKASVATNLVHIEPGWGKPEQNPHPASIVRTEMGSMRNHLVVRSADLVIAVAGGAGTLSEIAVAWQEGKSIAALRGCGGWSERLAGSNLDHRRTGDSIASFETIAELVNWATEQRPEGVFKGRINQNIYPLEVPCLHSVYESTPSAIHRINMRYGMAMEKTSVVRRLQTLNQEVLEWNRIHTASAVALVTFDDGWKEVSCLAEDFCNLPFLRPVLFLGENHYRHPLRPLPLQRFYHHCAEHGLDPEEESVHGGITRTALKAMPEDEQHAALDRISVDQMNDPQWLLNPNEIAALKDAGWIIATHGIRHEDMAKSEQLADDLATLSASVEERLHTPWLAWPEGLWSAEASDRAKDAGFHLQFALDLQPCEEPRIGTVVRKVWREAK